MGRRKPLPQDTRDNEYAVHLKPIFGIRPGVYLTVLYAFMAGAVLFSLLILPGIVRNGSLVSFVTYPEEAVVEIEGVYVGSTPCTVFVKRGTRAAVISKAYYEAVPVTLKIRGRLFLSLFSPRRETVSRALTFANPIAAAQELVGDYAKWAMALPHTANYQMPALARQTIGALAAQNALSPEQLYDILINLIPYMTSESTLSDLSAAACLSAGNGNPLSPLGYFEVLTEFLRIQDSLPALPLLLHDLMAAGSSGSPFSTETISAYRKAASAGLVTGMDLSPAALSAAGASFDHGSAIHVQGVSFVPVDAGRIERQAGTSEETRIAWTTEIPRFAIADREITNGLFLRFTEENPKWSAANREELVKRGLVTDEYLSALTPDADPELPVTYVSWYAARAFCDWLSSRLGASMPGTVIRLPSEDEFTLAALRYPGTESVFGRKAGPESVRDRRRLFGGAHDLLGNVWEWSDAWFAPSMDYVAPLSGTDPGYPQELLTWLSMGDTIPAAECVVKGGGWANTAREITALTRGSQPPSWCTPFLGFRPVLSRTP